MYYVQICLSSERYCIATERRPITRPFHPTDDEHKLYETVSEFLLRDVIELEKLGLVERTPEGVRAKREIILAFLPNHLVPASRRG